VSEQHDLRVLDLSRLELFRYAGVTRLTLGDDLSYVRVSVVRMFPVSDPNHYYGFLDGGGKDIGVVEEPTRMLPASRTVAEEELDKRYFMPVVERIVEIREDYGTLVCTVDTNRGRKTYLIRSIKDNVVELPGGRMIVTDVDGNRFEFPDVNALDARSQNSLMRNL
jgi:hypothetical protein